MALQLVDLPIDHFRLLGVSPAADAEAILRALQIRLDKPPEEGFTEEVLLQRAELLRRSSDLLTDQVLRQEYENALLQGAIGLELSSIREVAGLILLWEAEMSYEAFKLACKALKPPQAPALGSGREADLTLVAALSCSAAAIQEQEQRHYEAAGRLLQEGLQLLQRMGKLPDQRQKLEEDLEALTPYRILDLVSRDLGDQISHKEGLRLLENFVSKRGGLEGRRAAKYSGGFSQKEFEVFFQQIRKFLTVQEQVDLFIRWQRLGSADAGFLGAIALVAAGFSCRKPERIQEARNHLKSLNLEGVDPWPLLGCMDLLLADVQKAQEKFLNSPDEELKAWLDNYPGDSLAAICDYCRDWLRRDVLPGYRDVEVELVDLEAWFADRDVQNYIEQQEQQGPRGIAKASFSFLSSLTAKPEASSLIDDDNSFEEDSFQNVFDSSGNQQVETGSEILDSKEFRRNLLVRRLGFIYQFQIHILSLIRENIQALKNIVWKKSSLVPLVLVGGTFLGFILLRPRLPLENTFDEIYFPEGEKSLIDSEISQQPDVELSLRLAMEQEALFKNADKVDKETLGLDKLGLDPLTVEKPSEEEILGLLEAWLAGKASILLGGKSEILPKVARGELVKRVQEERSKDKALGESQIINASITSIKLVSRTPKRIEVKAKLVYKDQRNNSSGEIISQTSIPSLKVTYILGREKDLWQLVDYISGS